MRGFTFHLAIFVAVIFPQYACDPNPQNQTTTAPVTEANGTQLPALQGVWNTQTQRDTIGDPGVHDYMQTKRQAPTGPPVAAPGGKGAGPPKRRPPNGQGGRRGSPGRRGPGSRGGSRRPSGSRGGKKFTGKTGPGGRKAPTGKSGSASRGGSRSGSRGGSRGPSGSRGGKKFTSKTGPGGRKVFTGKSGSGGRGGAGGRKGGSASRGGSRGRGKGKGGSRSRGKGSKTPSNSKSNKAPKSKNIHQNMKKSKGSGKGGSRSKSKGKKPKAKKDDKKGKKDKNQRKDSKHVGNYPKGGFMHKFKMKMRAVIGSVAKSLKLKKCKKEGIKCKYGYQTCCKGNYCNPLLTKSDNTGICDPCIPGSQSCTIHRSCCSKRCIKAKNQANGKCGRSWKEKKDAKKVRKQKKKEKEKEQKNKQKEGKKAEKKAEKQNKHG